MVKKFKQLVWLGAGNAAAPKGLIDLAETILLVEAREDAYQNLISIFSNTKTVVVKQAVINSEGGNATFYQYNLPEFSALHKATGLTQLFPGLKLEQQDTVTSQSIAELLSEVKVTGEDNVLVIDIVDISLNLLQLLHAEHLLHCFGRILLISSHEALYQDASKGDELTKFMQNHGFYLASEDKTDPDLPWHTFVSNPLWKELKQAEQHEAELNQQLDAQRQQLAEQAKQAEQHEAELNQQLDAQRQQLAEQAKQAAQHEAELNKQLDAQRQQLAEQAKQAAQHEAELNKQLDAQRQQLEVFNQQSVRNAQQTEQLQQELALVTQSNKVLHEQLSAVTVASEKKQAELVACIDGKDAELVTVRKTAIENQQQLTESQRKVTELQDDIGALKSSNAVLSTQISVSQTLEKQFEVLENKLTNDWQKKLGNNVKQLEAFISLNDLLRQGDMPLNYHGWPISADIALYLAKKVVTESFDYIIEFGSGTSTAVFAKAIKIRDAKSDKGNQCRVITFEHNKTYLTKTASDLQMHQVDQLVDLVYAPLVDMEFEGTSYLYYSCESKLAELAQLLQGTEAKILVLVDGPPANTCVMARYPAIPLLIKYLAKHQLHIVMDDYVRDEEKKAAAKWSKLFEERGIKHQKELLNFEKVGFSWILNS